VGQNRWHLHESAFQPLSEVPRGSNLGIVRSVPKSLTMGRLMVTRLQGKAEEKSKMKDQGQGVVVSQSCGELKPSPQLF
jgi:hypothetical protein